VGVPRRRTADAVGGPRRGGERGAVSAVADRRNSEDGVERAIARVLDAEHAAHASVSDAEREAAAIVERARADARALAERAERRIRAARSVFEAHTAAQTAALDAEAAAAGDPHELSAGDHARVSAAVAAVAARLTGGAG
jgi:hypothetical protein